MALIVGIIALLVFAVAYLTARGALLGYTLKKRHLECLMRLDDQVRISLPPDAGDMVSAAINEELEGV